LIEEPDLKIAKEFNSIYQHLKAISGLSMKFLSLWYLYPSSRIRVQTRRINGESKNIIPSMTITRTIENVKMIKAASYAWSPL